jgi:hypothetical protein
MGGTTSTREVGTSRQRLTISSALLSSPTPLRLPLLLWLLLLWLLAQAADLDAPDASTAA